MDDQNTQPVSLTPAPQSEQPAQMPPMESGGQSGGGGGNKKWLIPVFGVVIIVAVVFTILKMRSGAGEPAGDQAEVQQNTTQQQVSVFEKLPATEPSRMYIEPQLLEPAVGDTFDVVVSIDTMGNNSVVANAVLTWNPQILEMVSSDARLSAYPLQAISEQEVGSFAMARGVPGDGDQYDSDDGFTGDAQFMTVTFKAKQAGSTTIGFDTQESAVILDDGKGTRTVIDFAGAEVFVN